MDTRRIKQFFTQTPFWQLIVASFVLLLGSAVALWALVPQTEKLLILHYSIPFGIDRVGPWIDLWYIPLFGLLLLIWNIIIAFSTFVQQRVFAQITLVAACFLELIIAASVALLIYQNS